MKAEDLMIGDWVQVPSEDNPLFLQVLGICPFLSGEYYAYTNPIIDRQPLWIKILEPIPLTPDLLEKNGIHQSDTGEFFDEDINSHLEISVKDGCVYWTININEYDIIPLRYVHELQHALKLCGIEKEIVL